MADGDGQTKAVTQGSTRHIRLLIDLLPVVRPWISHNLSGPQFFLIYKMIKSLKSLKVNIRQNPDTELPSAVGQPALCLFHVQ